MKKITTKMEFDSIEELVEMGVQVGWVSESDRMKITAYLKLIYKNDLFRDATDIRVEDGEIRIPLTLKALKALLKQRDYEIDVARREYGEYPIPQPQQTDNSKQTDNDTQTGNNKPQTDNNKKPHFRDIIQYEDKDKLLKRLHGLIDGKRGADVGAVLLKAKIDKYLTRCPTEKEYKSEFSLNGTWAAIKKYLNQNTPTAEGNANKIAIF